MKTIQYRFILLFLFTFLLRTTLPAQEKGAYAGITGQVGSAAFTYDLEHGSRQHKPGYGFGIKYDYYFSSHWGVSTGLNLSRYSTQGKQNEAFRMNTYESLGAQVDDDEISGNSRDYELRLRTGIWQESQRTLLMEIPLMALYQIYVGDRQAWGFYGGAGLKLQIPVRSKYSIEGKNNQLNVSGYYAESNIDFGAPGLPPMDQHGFGTTETPENALLWSGKNKLHVGMAGAVEVGCIKKAGKNIDVLLGGYVDYGFIDMQKKRTSLFQAPAQYLPAANHIVGKNIEYHGWMNSNKCDNLKPFSVGLKLGVRFKL